MKSYPEYPYHDDYDDKKKYYQILFKPGTAVQARELTQLQTILRTQIERLGEHIFQQGSVVIPGNSYAEIGLVTLKIASIANGSNVSFEGKTIFSPTTGVKAVVKKIVNAENDDPMMFFISYTSSGNDGESVFVAGETLSIDGSPGPMATIINDSDYSGFGSIASVNEGVYYVSGSFVYVEKQTIVVDKFSSTPSCRILLKITEDTVNYLRDPSLLDPSRGFNNYAAPGADRVYISLDLVSLSLDEPIDENYIELIRYKDGVVQDHNKNARYSEIDKYIARRTYDESGNYLVHGLVSSVKEHLKEGNNRGVYEQSDGGDISKLAVEVTPGKAYLYGFETNVIAKKVLTTDKARTSGHIKSTELSIKASYGQYILIANPSGQSISIEDDLVIENSNGDSIGGATVIGIDYYVGDSASNNVYKVWVKNLSSSNLSEASTVSYSGGSGSAAFVNELTIGSVSGPFTIGEIVSHTSGRRTDVIYWNQFNQTKLYVQAGLSESDDSPVVMISNEVPKVGDIITGEDSTSSATIRQKTLVSTSTQNSALIFDLPKNFPFSITHPELGDYTDVSYTIQKELTITTDSSGNGSVSALPGETFLPIEQGTFLAFKTTDGTIVDLSAFGTNDTGTTLSISGGPLSSSITVFANIEKVNRGPKTKTRTTVTETSLSPTSTITLSNTDVISVVSIVENSTPPKDITSTYVLSTGQTDYSYERGSLERKPEAYRATSDLSVTYVHYDHSVAGDYFCIDSYPSGIHETGIQYKSNKTGKIYDLAASIDFRKSNTSSVKSAVVSNSFFRSWLQYYVGRKDSVVIGTDRTVSIVNGIPSEHPVPPSLSSDSYLLDVLTIPPYTRSATDVDVSRRAVERYTMENIDGISKRIDRLEEFVTLSIDEQETINYEVIDAETGLSRFKTGYVVENFNDPFTIGRTTSGDFSVAFQNDNTMIAKMEKERCDVFIDVENSSGYTFSRNSEAFMLRYEETPFIIQEYSSRTTNLNPFLVVSWNGVLEVVPPSFDWIEVRDLPDITETVVEEVIIENYLPCPSPPLPDPPSPYPGIRGPCAGMTWAGPGPCPLLSEETPTPGNIPVNPRGQTQLGPGGQTTPIIGSDPIIPFEPDDGVDYDFWLRQALGY